MGLSDRSSCAAVVVAALGMFMTVGCSSEAAQLTQPNAKMQAAVSSPAHAPLKLAATPAPAVSATVEQTRGAVHSGAMSVNDLRVMSFNCRVSTLFDLTNTWGLRKGLLVETVKNFGPDLLGTQECLASQSDYLREQLASYDFIGVGRSDGKRAGEMCGIYFKRAKFEKLDSGHFWLSETPSVPGSKGWGAWFPRMVTWVKLQPRDGGTPFVWFNTHLDAFSNNARINGAKLLRSRIATIAGTLPVVVTGDFNADAGTGPYQTMLGSAANAAARLTDTFRAIYATQTRNDGTRHGFHGGKNGPRIDWILASSAFRTVDATIDYAKSGFSYPSDHFPVTAVLRPVTSAPALARIE